MSRSNDLKKLIVQNQRRLQTLRERKAQSGLDTPAAILTEIEDIETEIEQLEAELKREEKYSYQSDTKSPNNVRRVVMSSPSKGNLSWMWISIGITALLVVGVGGAFLFNFSRIVPTSTPTSIPEPSNIALKKCVTIKTNKTDDPNLGAGEWPDDITDGSLDYIGAGAREEDGVIGFVNNDSGELMKIEVTIHLDRRYHITKIRYNPGNVAFGDTWTADEMESPFGRIKPIAGWTEQVGSITAPDITITFMKTRSSDATDWLFIGEVEVYGVPTS